MIKHSIYSHQFKRDNNFYLYNSETSFFIQISERLYRLLYNREFDAIDSQTKEELLKHKFLVDEKDLYNYYNSTKMKFSAGCHNTKHLTLVLVPTTACNFSCPYCFEGEKKIIYMSEKVMTDIINFINGHENVKTLSITWYGGEPLLAFSQMEKLLKKIKDETNVKITYQGIISNGYLLTEKMIEFFSINEFKLIQITLDGKKENHDKTRYLGSKHISTFDKIIANAEKAANALPNCKISIRVNVKMQNVNDYIDLYTYFHNLKLNNIYVYPGFIREETVDGHRMCYDSLFNHKDRYLFYEQLSLNGVNVNFIPKHCSKGCMTSTINSYIIGPEGEIYKCWNDVNHPEKVIGNISGKDITNQSLFYAYHEETTVFVDDKCKDCMVFPICGGGCAWYRLKNLKEDKEFNVCSLYLDISVLEECLLKNLEKRKSDLPILNIS